MKNLRISLVLLPLSLVALSLSGCATTSSTHTTAQVSNGKDSNPLPPVAEGPGPEPAPSNARSPWGAGASPSTF